MGVPVRIALFASSRPAAREAAAAAFARVRTLDAMMSDYRPDSELNALSAAAGGDWRPASAELFDVLARARELADATDGAFDPTVGPLVALWREARDTGRLPDDGRRAEAMTRTGWQKLEIDPARQAVRLVVPGMRLDLGGIAKGFILDEALAALRARGVTRALLEAGGDIVVGAAPPGERGWVIDVGEAGGELADRARALTHAAIATSGADAQFVEVEGTRYSHVVDPATGLGLTHARVARVIARDGATADALATALGVAGPIRGLAIIAAFPDVIVALTALPTPPLLPHTQRSWPPLDATSSRSARPRRRR